MGKTNEQHLPPDRSRGKGTAPVREPLQEAARTDEADGGRVALVPVDFQGERLSAREAAGRDVPGAGTGRRVERLHQGHQKAHPPLKDSFDLHIATFSLKFDWTSKGRARNSPYLNRD